LSAKVNIHATFVDLEILNPTITVILMAKFNPTITAYLVPYITEGYDNKKMLLLGESILLKAIPCGLPIIYTFTLGPAKNGMASCML